MDVDAVERSEEKAINLDVAMRLPKMRIYTYIVWAIVIAVCV